MKYVTKALFSVVYALTLMAASVSVQAETIKTRIGERHYRLRVNADVPAKHFWSMAIYDVATRSFIETDQRGVEFNNRVSDLDYNEDGSVDLYLGPTPPEGKEKNWIKTIPGKTWHAYFRWYGPTETYWDGTWKLNDIEKWELR